MSCDQIESSLWKEVIVLFDPINMISKILNIANNAESSQPWFKLQFQIRVILISSLRDKENCIPYVLKNVLLKVVINEDSVIYHVLSIFFTKK